MPAKQITPHKQIIKHLEKQIERNVSAILNAFAYAGEECVTEARQNGKYVDRTGNLKSSIGYVVLNNGKVYQQGGFEQTGGGTEGVRAGKASLSELRAGFPKGIVLIVVAGMKYAVFVEAMGLNVITSAELRAERLIPYLLKKLGFEVTG